MWNIQTALFTSPTGFSKADEQVSTALPSTAKSGTIVAQCTSSPFHVVHSREFTGISESTPLAKSFASQGVHIPIRNETKCVLATRNSQEQPANRRSCHRNLFHRSRKIDNHDNLYYSPTDRLTFMLRCPLHKACTSFSAICIM